MLLPFSPHLPPPPSNPGCRERWRKGGKAENSFIRTEITTTWREPEATHTHTCTDTHTPSHVEDTSWPNHTCLRDVLKRDRLMNTDRWGRVKRNIKSTTWDFIFLCSQLSNMLQRDSDQDWQLLHCQVYLHHSIYCTNYQLHPPTLWHPICTPRDSLAATTMSRNTLSRVVCVCVYVSKRASGVTWGHWPSYAAEAVCHYGGLTQWAPGTSSHTRKRGKLKFTGVCTYISRFLCQQTNFKDFMSACLCLSAGFSHIFTIKVYMQMEYRCKTN